MKRLLTIHGSAGGGHRAAALAINQALVERGAEPMLADILSFAGPWFRSFYGRGYELAAQHMRWLCRLIYTLTDRPHTRSRLVDAVERNNAAKVAGLAAFLEENRVEAVCCTHFLPMRLVADLRRQGRYAGELQVCVTDYQAHGFWFDPGVDLYHVATASAAERLIGWGVPANRIRVTGIPVRREFTALVPGAPETGEGRRILFMANSVKVREVLDLLADLASLGKPLSITLVTGRNRALARALDAYTPPPLLTIERRGHEPHLERLMVEADILVTKPGGIICSEALAAGLPMLFVTPIPNHEVHNAHALAEAGAGVVCFGRVRLSDALRRLSEEPGRLMAMRQAALSLARPDAAAEIAAALLEPRSLKVAA